MSLNWKEINQIIEELDLQHCHVQQIFQRDFRNIYFQIFKPGKTGIVRVCLEQGKSRIHSSRTKPKSRGVQPRFSEFLRARIRGGRIEEISQHLTDRIIVLKISRGSEVTLLFLKLWGNAANIIACDEHMTVLEAAFRRPGRNEAAGFVFKLPEAILDPEKLKKIQSVAIRPFSDADSLEESVAREYAGIEKNEARERYKKELLRYYSMRETSLSARLLRIKKAKQNETSADALQHKGDLVLNSSWKIGMGDKELITEDYDNNNITVKIPLDPGLNPSDNAKKYFDDAKKLRSRKKHLSEEEDNVELLLKEVVSILQSLDNPDLELNEIRELYEEMRDASRSSKGTSLKEGMPGLEFRSNGFRILVGRTAKENDALLRKHTRGNDTWLHTRDYPGGYVFIKYKSGKSVPLEVLLDAGNLALHFSKAKNNGQADMYYTQVKHLRRPKQGKTGLVLPTQEKNLFIKHDVNRLNKLLNAGSE